ncbi:MAG TPA: hypothetical protein V6C65_04255 [Allocoleopsis sp.]
MKNFKVWLFPIGLIAASIALTYFIWHFCQIAGWSNALCLYFVF